MRYLYMNLDAVKGMLEDVGWHVPSPEPQDQKFNKWIKTVPGIDNSLDATFKSMETGVELAFQEREKSDAGKLADRFTELLKKK